MQGGTQYWKPGEARPGTRSQGDRRKAEGKGSQQTKNKGKKRGLKDRAGDEGADNSNHNSTSSQNGDRRRKKGDEAGENDRRTVPSAGSKASAGPSQGLLAMKFMQRKAKAEETKRQHDKKRKNLENEFSSSFTKRLKADSSGEKDRLVCRPDEQDPAFVMLGRRSFGGFNVVAETAYTACVRDIAAGASIEEEDDDDDENGISDKAMANRLGGKMGRGRR